MEPGDDKPTRRPEEPDPTQGEAPAPETRPGSPRARQTAAPRPTWGFIRDDAGTVLGASVSCPACLREIRIVRPRFVILVTGYVETADEGRLWTCDACRAVVGPMRLDSWTGPVL